MLFKSQGSETYFVRSATGKYKKNLNKNIYKIYSILEDQLLTMSRETVQFKSFKYSLHNLSPLDKIRDGKTPQL